jgi:transketolase
MRDVFIAELEELAASDPRVFLITADLGFAVLDRFADRFPGQFLNVGVAEQNMTGVATGLALEGRIVFTYSIANFPTLRCLEQIRNDAAYHDANVKVVAIGGGFSYGALGMSHHATEDLAIMRSLGIPVLAPGCDWEAREATAAVYQTPGTCYLRLDKSSAGNTRRDGELFSLGRARRVREGDALTFIACGGILGTVLRAADMLSRDHDLECRVVSMHTVHPLDRNAVLDAAAETGGIITVEEHTIRGGLGGAVAECCLDDGITPRAFHRVGLRTQWPAVVGSQEHLRRVTGMDEAALVRTGLATAGAGQPIARTGGDQ